MIKDIVHNIISFRSFLFRKRMKHISHVDNVANLQALIKYELRELGIKVPKPKKTKRGTSKQNQVKI